MPRDKNVLFDSFEHKEVMGYTKTLKEYLMALGFSNGKSCVDVKSLAFEKCYKYVHLVRKIGYY